MMLEDPFSEDDKHTWPLLTESSKNTKIIGDDLYTSHKSLLKRGIQEKYTHGLIIKPNQVGLMSDIFKTIQCAKENNQIIIVSHRSGETLDSSIVDLAVGIGAWGVKIGAPARGERIAKYNRYLEILQTFI
jgi:enolase